MPPFRGRFMELEVRISFDTFSSNGDNAVTRMPFARQPGRTAFFLFQQLPVRVET
jgi:hypothetical protein